MKLLVLGCRGQLGRDLMQQAVWQGAAVLGADLPECDLTNPDSLADTLHAAGRLDVIINAAAFTAVDRAETDQETAFAVNRDGPGHLARFCRAGRLPLIHVSTDYVFDGTRRRPYAPEDPVAPLGIYGRSKAAGEAVVRRTWERHVIVRTAWLFGEHGPNFVKSMLRLGKEREELRVVDDQIGSPTCAADLAGALLRIASRCVQQDGAWGTYHFCNQGVVSWYAFARRIFELADGLDRFRLQRLVPIATTEYPVAARRPAYSVLDCTSLEARFGIQRRPYDDALKEILQKLYARPEAGRSFGKG